MIPAAIFQWTQVQPEKTAVDYNDESWSYRQFNDAIAKARGHFHAKGLTGPGIAIVAINHYRDWWVASLALRSLGLTTVVRLR